jgi:hypothetical protein
MRQTAAPCGNPQSVCGLVRCRGSSDSQGSISGHGGGSGWVLRLCAEQRAVVGTWRWCPCTTGSGTPRSLTAITGSLRGLPRRGVEGRVGVVEEVRVGSTHPHDTVLAVRRQARAEGAAHSSHLDGVRRPSSRADLAAHTRDDPGLRARRPWARLGGNATAMTAGAFARALLECKVQAETWRPLRPLQRAAALSDRLRTSP